MSTILAGHFQLQDEIQRARQELISPNAKLAYPIRDGVPLMLPEEARQIGEGEAEG